MTVLQIRCRSSATLTTRGPSLLSLKWDRRMLEHRILGATIVDGTGAPAYDGDLGVRDGRIVAIVAAGTLTSLRTRRSTPPVSSCAPGFVDLHTHYDAQLFWDPLATPSNVHGVTTVIGGNCSFSLAPLRDADADYTRRMMAKVEGMPLAALEQGVPWTWETFGDYLAALDGNVGVNAGFLLGHCALRRYVMGAEANRPRGDRRRARASCAPCSAMRSAHGALGLVDRRVDTRTATATAIRSRRRARDADELLALCAASGSCRARRSRASSTARATGSATPSSSCWRRCRPRRTGR